MASAYTEPNGRQRVNYSPPGFKRQTLRLGQVSRAEAEDFARRVDRLIRAKKLGELPDIETAKWVRRIDRRFYNQLARVGLVEKRDVFTVGQLMLWFVDLKSRRVKASTLRNTGIVAENAKVFFGPDAPIESITPQRADAFRKWLLTTGSKYQGPLASATVSRRCRRVSEVFEEAVAQRWLASNPFAHMGQWSEVNEKRDRYIGTDVVEALCALTDDIHLRLMLALSRYAAVRGLAEFEALQWDWIDRASETMQVLAPKTEHHPNRRFRTVPIFPELRPYIQDCWDATTPGDVRVFKVLPDKHSAITGRVDTLCKRLGLVMPPKFFTNSRASCERDWLNQGTPIDTVAAWAGHSPETMLRHYSRVAKQRIARNAAQVLRPAETDFFVSHKPQHDEASK